MSSIKIWETIRSLHAKCSLPVAVRVSKTLVLKHPSLRFQRRIFKRSNQPNKRNKNWLYWPCVQMFRLSLSSHIYHLCFVHLFSYCAWSHGCLKVCARISGSSGLGSSPGDIVLCSWARHSTNLGPSCYVLAVVVPASCNRTCCSIAAPVYRRFSC